MGTPLLFPKEEMTDLPQPPLHCGYQAPGPNKFARPESGYTADQMREYGAPCREQALEEALKICEDRINYGEVSALLCRDRIKELK
jgi:hypothetical protein